MANKKLKKAACFTTLLAGGIIATNLTGCDVNKSDTAATQNTVQADNLSVAEMEKRIAEMTVYMEDLQKTINSKNVDPETRFEARQAYKENQERLEKIQERLKEKNKNETLNFYDAEKIR